MRFMILVRASAQSESAAAPNADDRLMAAMADYHEQLAAAGVLLDASGLQPSAKGWRIRYAGGRQQIIGGPFAETKELVAGYWILQTKSLAEAVEWIKRCPNPHCEDSEIEIRQIFELEDFGDSEAIEQHRKLEKMTKK
jgi:hypothetical protein